VDSDLLDDLFHAAMAVNAREPQAYWDERGLLLLWFAIVAGPLAVALNMGAGYALVKWACASDHAGVLTMISVGTCALALMGAWVGWTCTARLRDGNERGGGRVDRSYFMAIVATGLSLLTALLIVMQAYPHFVLSPCE
jgi:hypothetical protein